jgi:hypothetical protein
MNVQTDYMCQDLSLRGETFDLPTMEAGKTPVRMCITIMRLRTTCTGVAA